jgi:hypothetical protein
MNIASHLEIQYKKKMSPTGVVYSEAGQENSRGFITVLQNKKI